jgi:hypothetical protein
MGENLSPADISAVVGNTDRPYYPMYSGNNGFGGESGWIWLIVILALLGGFNGNGFGGGYGNNDFAWLSNGQKEIMQNTNNGFDTLHLSNQIEGVRDGVAGLSNQICNSFADAESNDNARHIANMQQAFSNQLSTVQGFNTLGSKFADCCCENRLGIADLKATVLAENCADREALREVGQSILVNQNENTQKIIDEIFRDRLDEKDSKIADLQRELQMADLRASQIAQTQAITSNIYNELKNCPVGTVPVYGSQPIFTCPGNSGCGCGTYGTTLV